MSDVKAQNCLFLALKRLSGWTLKVFYGALVTPVSDDDGVTILRCYDVTIMSLMGY